MPSFDVVSKLDHHELNNAIDQAKREVSQRYDFRGTDTEIEQSAEGITIRANSESRVEAALGVLRDKVARRKLSLKCLNAHPPKPAAGATYRQLVELREGIDQPNAKKIVKLLKDSSLKVQAAIQGDSVRVSHKKRDVLQQAISFLKEKDMDMPLQFENFRD